MHSASLLPTMRLMVVSGADVVVFFCQICRLVLANIAFRHYKYFMALPELCGNVHRPGFFPAQRVARPLIGQRPASEAFRCGWRQTNPRGDRTEAVAESAVAMMLASGSGGMWLQLDCLG